MSALQWTSIDTWIVIVATVSAMACALLGNFLVLRKMSMMGDAISHAVLPGLAIAFLWTNSLSSLPMFIGAAVVGLLTALFTQAIHRHGKVEESAAMGVVFTTLFAVGLILIEQASEHMDIDPNCVLMGNIELTPLDTWLILGQDIPRAGAVVGAVLLLNVIVVTLFYKEFKLCAFDPSLATTLGINANVMHYLLMALVAVTTVAAFEAVGSILVIAMLIVPGATAYLLTDRLHWMLVISLLVAAVSAVGGHLLALILPGWFGFHSMSTSGTMATLVGGLFTVAMLFGPRHGLLSRLRHRLAIVLQINHEDVLGILYRLEESKLEQPLSRRDTLLIATDTSRFWLAISLWQLRRKGWLQRGDDLDLTPSGREAGSNLMRSHRLWETYMEKLAQQPRHQQHRAAEYLEHVTDTSLAEHLAEQVGDQDRDPQGKRIPRRPDTDN